jgi:hypothetical protein
LLTGLSEIDGLSADSAAASPATLDPNSLRGITSSNLTYDDDEQEPDSMIMSRNIADIFNFDNSMWTEISKELAIRGLDDELELYELVDLDAAGDLDDPAMIDEMARASLSI